MKDLLDILLIIIISPIAITWLLWLEHKGIKV